MKVCRPQPDFICRACPDSSRQTIQFGKQIQAEQVPGWSQFYLDYKSLKKIISSLAAHRPASEAAALTVGVHPRDFFTPRGGSQDTVRSSTPSADEIPLFASFGHDDERGADFQAHKAAFFFKLERELEKVSHANPSRPHIHRQSPSRSMRFISRRKPSLNSASRPSSPSEEQRLCMFYQMPLMTMPPKTM